MIIQIADISGSMMDNGKWDVEFPAGLQQDQTVSINLPIKDPALIGYIGKSRLLSCVIDREDNNYMVAIACIATRIRHMVNTATLTVESMAILTPSDRTCEHVLRYLLTPGKCDPRFVRLVRGIEKVLPPHD